MNVHVSCKAAQAFVMIVRGSLESIAQYSSLRMAQLRSSVGGLGSSSRSGYTVSDKSDHSGPKALTGNGEAY